MKGGGYGGFQIDPPPEKTTFKRPSLIRVNFDVKLFDYITKNNIEFFSNLNVRGG